MNSRIMFASLMVGVMAVVGCGGDDSAEEAPPATETNRQTEEAAEEEEPQPTETTRQTGGAVEEESGASDDEIGGTTTAVTTGNVTIVESFDESGAVGEPELQMEVTMDGGQVRSVAVDEATLMTIWPDGMTADGVRVRIELVDGEERVTGPAGAQPRPSDATQETEEATEEAPPGSLFNDPFDGELGDGWRWRSESPELWSLSDTPGWLTITAVDAPQNVLVRDAPNGRFEVETAVRFDPTSNFQFAGVFVGSDTTSFIQLGRAYCSSTDVPSFCIDDGVYMDNVSNGENIPSSALQIPAGADVIHLRLVVDGESVSGYVSGDGETWTLVGEQNRSGVSTEVGLIAGQALVEPAVAEFDHFTLVLG